MIVLSFCTGTYRYNSTEKQKYSTFNQLTTYTIVDYCCTIVFGKYNLGLFLRLLWIINLVFSICRFLAFLFLLPLVQTYFFNLAIGHDPTGLYIAVVNNELHGKHLGECKSEYYQGCFLDNPKDVIMSCAYVDQMKSRTLNIVSFLKIFFLN